MNTLYFVSLYNHRRNEFARFLLTVPGADIDRARREAQTNMGEEWQVRIAIPVCITTDEVFQEV